MPVGFEAPPRTASSLSDLPSALPEAAPAASRPALPAPVVVTPAGDADDLLHLALTADDLLGGPLALGRLAGKGDGATAPPPHDAAALPSIASLAGDLSPAPRSFDHADASGSAPALLTGPKASPENQAEIEARASGAAASSPSTAGLAPMSPLSPNLSLSEPPPPARPAEPTGRDDGARLPTIFGGDTGGGASPTDGHEHGGHDHSTPPAPPLPSSLGARGLPIIATGTGLGEAPLVKAFDAVTGQLQFQFYAYETSFQGGVRVALADFDFDGLPDIVTAPGPGRAPEVKLFSGKDGTPLAYPYSPTLLAYDASFQNGLYVAAGDVDGDAIPEIITGPEAGGGSQVRIFSALGGGLLQSFHAYAAPFSSGVRVAAADLAGDFRAEVVVAPGPGAAPLVRVFDGNSGQPIAGAWGSGVLAYAPGASGGVYVATGDVDGDGKVDVVTGPGAGSPPMVKVFSGPSGTLVRQWLAYEASFQGGVRVATAYIDADDHADVVTGKGWLGEPRVKEFSGATGAPLTNPGASFLAYAPPYAAGLHVAAANDPQQPIVTVTITPKWQNTRVNTSVTITVTWSSDTPPSIPGPWSTRVVWGDGTQDSIPTSPAQSGSFTASHTYNSFSTGTRYVSAVVSFGTSQGSAGGTGNGIITVLAANEEAPPALPPEEECGCGGSGGDVLRSMGDLGGGRPSGFSGPGIRYADGVIKFSGGDLASSGFGIGWGQSRSFTNGPGYASNAANGDGWVDGELPYLMTVGGTTNTLAAVGSGTTARYFDADQSGNYSPRFYDRSAFGYDGTSGQYVLTDTAGNTVRYHDFSGSLPAARRGAFVSHTDPKGNTTAVTSWTTDGRAAEVQRSVSQSGVTTVESYQYSYLTSGTNAGKLSSVTLRHQVGGGSWATVRAVEYTYYDGMESYGTAGDLKLVVVKDAAGSAIDTSYYRYYTAGQSNGYAGGLRYAFGPQAYGRLAAAFANPQTATDTQVSAYADAYYEYDSSKRVTKAVVAGAGCSACTGGLGTFTYSYTASSNAPGPNSWSQKTVETLPDGNTNTVYTNWAGEVILSAFQETATSNAWVTFSKYDEAGRRVLAAQPSAISGYSDSYADLLHSQSGNYQYLRDSEGLIQTWSYGTSTTATDTTAGNVEGRLYQSSLQRGETGTGILQGTTLYFTRTAGGVTISPVASETRYRNTDGTGGQTTSYGYTWFSGTTQMESLTVTKPVVTTAQNGPGTADTETTFYDTYGRAVWHRDGDGFLSFTAFDPVTGAVTKTITDVNTSQTSDFTGLPSGWSTPSGGGLHLITQYEADALGRTTKVTDPIGNVTYTVYKDTSHEVRVYPGWDTSTSRPTGPTQVSREDRAGSYTESLTMSATPSVTSGRPDGTEAIGSVQTLSRSYTNDVGQVVTSDAYVNLSGLTYSTSTSLGTENTHYYRTRYGYLSPRGWQTRVQSPTGTITRTVFDALGRVSSTWVGLDDTPTSGTWSPTNTAGTDLVKVSENVYDSGGIGDSNLTQTTLFPGGSAADRVTRFFYDWRDRQVATKSGVQASEGTDTQRPISYVELDNLGQNVASEQYDADNVAITDANSDGVPDKPSSSLLHARSTRSYDEQGRTYQTKTYSVDPSTGAVSTNALTTNTWFDHRGQTIKTAQPGGLVMKQQYDGAGRTTKTFTSDGGGDTAWSDADDVTSDIVLTQLETTYDAAGNGLLTTTRDRFHDETATGALGDATTSPKARVSSQANYYDKANRLTDSVDVGTNGGSAYTRPSSVPSRSDTVLVTSQAYNDAGWVETTTDPRGIQGKRYYDNLGQTIKTIEAYVDGTPSNSDDKTTEYTYDGAGHMRTLKAWLTGGAYQETEFVYGVTTATGSDLNSNDVLAATKYPDKSTGAASNSEKESYTVNALGQRKTLSDRNGSVHTYGYDVLGRLLNDAVKPWEAVSMGPCAGWRRPTTLRAWPSSSRATMPRAAATSSTRCSRSITAWGN